MARSVSRMKSWFKQMVASVDYMHKKNKIHRDLKVGNLILTYSYLVRRMKEKRIVYPINLNSPGTFSSLTTICSSCAILASLQPERWTVISAQYSRGRKQDRIST